MLINIDPILSPEVLHTLRAMGHGDKLILCDSNFPAYSMNSRVHRIDGVDAAKAAKAIFSIFPLDSFIKYPVIRMQIDDNPDELNDVHKELNNIMHKVAGTNWEMGSIERFKFFVFCKFFIIFSLFFAWVSEIKVKKIRIKKYLNIKAHLFYQHDLLY